MRNKKLANSSRRDFLKKASTITAATTTGLALNLEIPTLKAAQEKKPRYAMLIDLRKCYGCRACTISCKSEFQVPLGVFRTVVKQKEKGTFPKTKRFFQPIMCNHCANPPCVEVCPVDPVKAIYKYNGREVEYEKRATYSRPDGAVLVDYERCIGCQLCVEECPYKARYVDPIRKAGGEPENNTVGKCTLCVHRVDQEVPPSCVNTCPAQARIFGNINDPLSKVSQLLKEHKTQVLFPEERTDPHVFYIAFEEGIYEKGRRWIDEIR
ncbi:MAG: 4Fe-4S dicluster domain-containing protein [Candidatus Aminicenantia bacterium]